MNGPTLTLTFSEVLDTSASPSASVFSVGGTDATTSVTAAGFKSGDATKVELTLSPAVSHGDADITVSYTKGTNPLQDGAGNEGGELHGPGGDERDAGHDVSDGQ